MEADIAYHRSKKVVGRPKSSATVSAQRVARTVDLDMLLPRNEFLRQLRRDKRRSDRSGAPLSIALFDVDIARGPGPRNMRTLGRLLAEIIRETDEIGVLRENRLAVILHDTGEQGARSFIRNVGEHADGLVYSVTVATYPDQLFERLAVGSEPEAESLLIEDATQNKRLGALIKRGMDIAGSAVLILLISPLLLVTAAAIATTSPGPVIFSQTRLGRRGLPFTFYKFRSMRTDSDDKIHREYVANLIQGNLDAVNQGDAERPHYKIKADPRVTAVGRIIRKTSIDELPQLYNVLIGDMSLVGPRPPLSYEAEKYQSWHLRRVLEIRPGITGLWQVEGRNKTSFDDMVRLDLRYIQTWSLWLDIKILIRTVVAVARGGGDE